MSAALEARIHALEGLVQQLLNETDDERHARLAKRWEERQAERRRTSGIERESLRLQTIDRDLARLEPMIAFLEELRAGYAQQRSDLNDQLKDRTNRSALDERRLREARENVEDGLRAIDVGAFRNAPDDLRQRAKAAGFDLSELVGLAAALQSLDALRADRERTVKTLATLQKPH